MEHTEEQKAAVESLAPRICVDAGAGSGKTRVLVERILFLIAQRQAKLDEIVAITFTDKAAAEMKDRLRRAFRERATPRDVTPGELSFWRELERRVDTARISTIHSFCAALLRENALHLGLDPDFTVLTEAESILLRSNVATETIHTLLDKGDPAAIRLATEMPLHRLKALLEGLLKQHFVIERIRENYTLTDPAALADEWQARVAGERLRRLEALHCSPRLRRFLAKLHGFDGLCCNPEDGREVRREIMLDAFDAIAAAADAESIEGQLERILDKAPRGAKKNWPSEDVFTRLTKLQDDIVRFVKKLLEREAPDTGLERRAAELTCDLAAAGETVREAFDAAKRNAISLDFDDLITRALHTLRENEPLRARIAQGIPFLLIDEFQDTDRRQLEIARLLADAQGGPDLFIVGDAKQSIYYFRGAEVEVFREAQRDTHHVLPLRRNFRSLPELLGFINAFFSASGLLDACGAYAPMDAHRPPATESRIEFLVTHPPEDAHGKWLVEDYRRKEAALIGLRIGALCGGEAALRVYDEAEDRYRPAAFGDCVLLFRAMSSVRLYEQALCDAGIPYVLVAGAGFYALQEITDVANLLKVLADPWDEAALLGFLRGPVACVSDESLLRLARRGGLANAFLTDAALEDPVQAKRLDAARRLIAGLRARTEMPLGAFLRHMLEETGLEAILLGQRFGLQKASNVRKLVDLAQEFTQGRPATLRAFLQYLDEVRGQEIREGEADLLPEGADAVTLMTIHKAKGLEFPVVFLPDMSQGRRGSSQDALFVHRELGMALKVTSGTGDPANPAIADAIRERILEEEEAEHARVLYVAMTRARDYLVMCGSAGPAPGSWFDALDDEYAITSRRDGDRFGEDGWQAVVRRDEDQPARRQRVREDIEPPSPEALRRRVGPLVQTASSRNTFAISTLLDYLADGFDEHQERRSEDEIANVARRAREAVERGRLVHRMFELWDFRSEAPIHAVMAESQVSPRNGDRLVDDLSAIARRFRASPLGKRLAPAAGGPRIEREAPFSLNVGDALITGAIDACLADGTIIDYKTGACSDARHTRYEWQLLLYAAAVHRLLGRVAPAGLLYYVDEARTVEVVLGPERIETALRRAREVIAQLRVPADVPGSNRKHQKKGPEAFPGP